MKNPARNAQTDVEVSPPSAVASFNVEGRKQTSSISAVHAIAKTPARLFSIKYTTETTIALDYWLSQFSGVASGVFSITGRDLTGSAFDRAEWGNSTVLSPGDQFNNSVSMGIGHPDGVPDNVLGPRNGPSLGGRFSNMHNPPGTHQVATFTLTLSLGAAPGLYQIRTFTYPKHGWVDPGFGDNPFDAHAAINVAVVPEPTTWALLGIGLLVLGAAGKFQRRR